MPRPRTFTQVTTLLAVAALVLAGCSAKAGSSSAAPFADGTPVTQQFPPAQRVATKPVTGQLLDGTAFDLGSLKGSVVVVNWWGSWCAPCRLEARHLESAYQATRDLGVAFLGVDVRDGRDAANAFVADFGITYPSLFDPGGRVALQFPDVPATVVPTTVILDRQGRVAAVFRKALGPGELDPVIRAIATGDGETIASTTASPAAAGGGAGS